MNSEFSHSTASNDVSKTSSLLENIEHESGISKLLAVVRALRHPETGCPWDLKQTHETLRPYLLEEAYEAIEAIHYLSDFPNETAQGALCEELGDVLLQVALHAQIAKDNGHYDFEKVAQGIADKLIRRHPHVFGDVNVESAEEVTANWAEIKKQEKAQQSGQVATSLLSKINRQQPALLQALDTSKKAVAVGFEWPSFESLWQCVMSEYEEFLAETKAKEADQQKRLEEEFGDILFASVNLARHFKINPEVALIKATQKFTRRFQAMEAELLQNNPETPLENQMKQLNFEAWDALWENAKASTCGTKK